MGSENSADHAWDFLSSWFVDIAAHFIWRSVGAMGEHVDRSGHPKASAAAAVWLTLYLSNNSILSVFNSFSSVVFIGI
jgi:hypothetical protein